MRLLDHHRNIWGRPLGRVNVGSGGVLGVALTIGDQVFSSACNFIATVLLARALGLESFGIYSTVWLAIYLAMSLQLGLIVSPMISIGAKESGQEADAYYACVLVHQAIFVVTATVCIYGVLILVAQSTPQLTGVEIPGAAVAAAYLTQDFLRRYLFTRRRPTAVMAIDIINHGLKLGLIMALWWDGILTIKTALWAVTGAAALSAFIGLLLIGPLLWRPQIFWSTTLRQWRSARWLVLTGSAQWVLGYSGFLVTATLLDHKVLGALRATQSLLAVMNVVREVLDNVMPLLAGKALSNGGLPGLRRVLLLGMLTVALIGGAAIAGLGLFGPWLLGLLYGDQIHEFYWMVICYSFILPVTLVNLVQGCALRALERTRPIFLASFAAAGFNIIVIYPAAAFFGIAGVIAIAFLSELIILLILWNQSREIRLPRNMPTNIDSIARLDVATARSP